MRRTRTRCAKAAFSCWTLSKDSKWLTVDFRTTHAFAPNVDPAR